MWRNKFTLVVLVVGIFFLQGCSPQRLPEPEIALASKIFDRNGKLITTLYEENRIEVSLNEVSPYVAKGVVAVEDVRFYEHFGIDPIGIARAMVKNITSGKITEGGSTITQQTAKNLYLTNERTFTRKFKELYLTLLLERNYTKREILEMYLNQIYYGYRAYGIEAAAQTYFAKPAKDLTLAESALLTGIPARPNSFSPFIDMAAAKRRQALVLDRMIEAGYITPQEGAAAKSEPLKLASSDIIKVEKAPYFVEEIRKHLIEKYENGSELILKGGLSIYTTLDLSAQEAAEQAVIRNLDQTGTKLEGALVATDPKSGHVLAMVGGRSFATSKFNRATAQRQPGSAFKPFLYSAAIEAGYTSASIIRCEPVTFKNPDGQDYTPKDYGDVPYHYRDFTLKEALTISDNVVAVKINEQVGPKKLAEMASRMGIKSKLRSYLSLALGTSEVNALEMSSAFGVLANQGQYVSPLLITKIVDKDQVVLEENQPKRSQVIDAKTAYIVTDMLTGVVKPGGTAANVGNQISGAVAGKTGTTQNYQDAWFVGYTPMLSAAVWVGYDQPKSIGRTGGSIAAPIWADFVAAYSKANNSRFEEPMGIVKAEICADTGLLATPFSTKVIEMAFVKGTEPKQGCNVHDVPMVPTPGLPFPDLENSAGENPNGEQVKQNQIFEKFRLGKEYLNKYLQEQPLFRKGSSGKG